MLKNAKTGQNVFRIDCSPEEVFDVVGDLEEAPRWVPSLERLTKQTPGPVRAGTRYRATSRFLGQTFGSELEVTEYAPSRVFAHTGKGGPAEVWARFTFHPIGEERTEVTHDFAIKLAFGFGWMESAALKWARDDAQEAYETLAELVGRRRRAASA